MKIQRNENDQFSEMPEFWVAAVIGWCVFWHLELDSFPGQKQYGSVSKLASCGVVSGIFRLYLNSNVAGCRLGKIFFISSQLRILSST